MPITIVCPDCHTRIRAPDSVDGKEVTCPKCGSHFTAAAGSDPPAPAAKARPDSPPSKPKTEPSAAAPPPDPESWGEIASVPADTPPPKEKSGVHLPPPLAPPPRGPNVLVDFLLFRKMIAPAVIQIFFWLGFIGCVLYGGLLFARVLTLLQQSNAGFWPVAGYLSATLGVWFLGPLVVRIACETLILVFRIYDVLAEISQALRPPNDE